MSSPILSLSSLIVSSMLSICLVIGHFSPRSIVNFSGKLRIVESSEVKEGLGKINKLGQSDQLEPQQKL